MDVHINQPWANNLPANVHLFDVGRGFGRGFQPDSGDLPLGNQHIAGGVEAVGGVYDPSANKKQRIHAPAQYTPSMGTQAPGWAVNRLRQFVSLTTGPKTLV